MNPSQSRQLYAQQDGPQSYDVFADGSLVKRFMQDHNLSKESTYHFLEHPTFIRVFQINGTVHKYILSSEGWKCILEYKDWRWNEVEKNI
jgi:hypothetical protein